MSIKREILGLSRGKKQETANSDMVAPDIETKVEKRPVSGSSVFDTKIELEKEVMSSATADEKTAKKSVKKAKSFKSLDELLLDVFSKELKTGSKLKPIKIDKAHESALKRMTGLESSERSSWEKIALNFNEVDPTFKHLLHLLLASSEGKPALRRKLIEFAVLVISRNWIGKLAGSNNVFADLAGTVGIANPDAISVICRGIKDLFDKQIDNRKKAEASKEAQETQQFSLSVSELTNKKANVLAICCLWAAETGKAENTKVISQLKNYLLEVESAVEVEPTLTNYFFAAAVKEATPSVLAAVRYFEHTSARAEERRKSAELNLTSKEQSISSLKNDLNILNTELSERDAKIASLVNEIESLKSETHQRELSEQATRVHLRDDAGQAKARANTLLSEDIAPQIELALKALNRDTPKVEVAIHQIELALESIDKGLPWFSK
ncbi:hypothetical protein [Photobacterium leiognathi]|uniref:hypothetical protein n=1 Tax=Photobacterium leiognathi TaxID=553611 RepID=UPI002981EE61|nr:hypothetical protein [Photobacterium leiognathi]